MRARHDGAREPTESPGARGTHLGSALMSRKGDERRPRVKKRNLARVRRGGRPPAAGRRRLAAGRTATGHRAAPRHPTPVRVPAPRIGHCGAQASRAFKSRANRAPGKSRIKEKTARKPEPPVAPLRRHAAHGRPT